MATDLRAGAVEHPSFVQRRVLGSQLCAGCNILAPQLARMDAVCTAEASRVQPPGTADLLVYKRRFLPWPWPHGSAGHGETNNVSPILIRMDLSAI